jgi:hypothetical protein
MDYQHTFHLAVYSGKILLTLLLLILSLINGHTSFVEKNPRQFVAGCIIFAFLTALGSMFVAANRNADWMSAGFITVLFFFLFAVCREFSGYYALLSGETGDSQVMAKERKVLLPLGIVMAVLTLGVGGYLAYKAGVRPPTEMRFVNFYIELIIFAVLAALAETGVSVQHGDKSPGAAIATVFMFVIVHVYLQFGGFYDDIFAPLNWNAVGAKIN